MVEGRPPKSAAEKVVRVCGIGAPTASSSHGPALSSETPTMNTVVELPSHADGQLGKQRQSETSLEGELGMGRGGATLPLGGAMAPAKRKKSPPAYILILIGPLQ